MNESQEILGKLREILKSETGREIDPAEMRMEASLSESLGLDSVDLISVVIRVEECYRIRLNHEQLEKTQTLGGLVDLIGTMRKHPRGPQTKSVA